MSSGNSPGGWETADFVVGIDLGGTKVDIAAAGADGEPRASVRLETAAEHGAEQALGRAFAAAAELIGAQRSAGAGSCRAAAIVSPGIAHDGGIELAPNLPGLEQLRLVELVEGRLGVPAVVANDVKAGAFAEAHRGSLRGCDPAIFLSLGTGIAAAVVVGGEVVAGHHGAAGEIAYSLGGTEDLAAHAEGRAPLEEFAGGRALGERASAILGEPATAAAAFAREDGPLRELVDEAIGRLAVQVANMTQLIDPAAIAVAGGLTGSSEQLLAALRARLAGAIPFPPALKLARFRTDAGLRGAIAIALAQARAPTFAGGPR